MTQNQVFHVITTIEFGGAEKQLLTLTKLQVSNGLEVTILPLKGRPELEPHFQAAGVKVNLELIGKSTLLQIILLRKYLEKADIVHSHLPRAEILSFFGVKRKRWIVTRHNSERFLPIGPLFFSVSLSNVISIKAFRIIAISNAVFEYLHSSKEVLVKRKIEIVKYGYDNENLQLQNKSIDSKKVRTPINLICVSRLVEQKNLPLLLKATHEFKKRGIPVLLNIYGDGNLHDRLVRQSKVLEIDEIVKFQGKVENIYEFMRESDFLIHTSKYEGFGMVFIEAMQIGLPIITCKNAATEEVLGKDYIGLVDQDDVEAIVDKVIFLNDEVRKNQAIAYLKSRLDNFNPVLMERQISQIYFQRIE